MDENFCPECEYNVGPIWKFTECPLCGYSEADEEEDIEEWARKGLEQDVVARD